MNSMTSAEPMANTVFMAAPHNAHSVIPGSTTQVTLYPHNQPQVNLSPGNQSGLQTPASAPPAQGIFKEGKTLGVSEHSHHSLGTTLLDSGEREGLEIQERTASGAGADPALPNSGVLRSCLLCDRLCLLGRYLVHHFRIPVSSIREAAKFSLCAEGLRGHEHPQCDLFCAGICAYIVDICVNSKFIDSDRKLIPGKTTSGMLLIFSLLELFIASTCAHFGCQVVSYDTVVYQTVYVSNQVSNPEPENLPPSYSSEMQHSK
ncbi:membrane-spanning 4-domains subfamily A member 8-like [Sturnira hondurensis]|uniref:membrane-spanning 4-domains subfamily A member 8-like n=1 Tax=Sturnira hondurensis TaxID=192404 RepID=UPI00187A92F4|nr:membrane-spanning 4-domains subfamily A member 8-like [Sturnira hondurensis]